MTAVTAAAVPSVRARVSRKLADGLGWSLLGPIVIIALWETAAHLGLERLHILPAPTSILASLVGNTQIFTMNLPTTLGTAGLAYLLGVVAAVVLGLVCAVSRPIEAIVVRSAIVMDSLPTIALAPILVIIFTGIGPGVVMGAISVFFLTLINFVSGLAATPALQLEMNRAFGGSTAKALGRIRLRYATPQLITGMMLSAPAALVGALMSEFLIMGRGLGTALIAAQEELDAPRVWAIGITCAVLSASAFMALSGLRRLVAPWSGDVIQEYRNRAQPLRKPALVSALATAGSTVVTILILLVAWDLGIRIMRLTPFFAKGPLDVLDYLVLSPEAGAHLAEIAAYLGSTLWKAGLGLLLGVAIGTAIAALATVSRPFNLAFVPTLVAFRSLPLLAKIPVVALLTGGGVTAAIAIAGMLSFFTTAINLIQAARDVPKELVNLSRAYNVDRLRMHWQIHRYYMLPALFTSLKITAPLAIMGTMSAEWLATGTGIGHLMLLAGAESRYIVMWSGFVVVTIVSITVYATVSLLERLVKKRLS